MRHRQAVCFLLPHSFTYVFLSLGGGRTQVEKYFWPGEITQHIYHWQILPIFFNLVYGRTVPNEFPPNLLMGFVNGFC